MTIKDLLENPLVHFLILGGLLVVVASILSGGDPDSRSNLQAGPARRISVDAETLKNFVQLKTRVEDPEIFASTWRELDASARAEWLALFVREEALVREARRLGLDQEDDLIRRRLVQQMEFVALGQVASTLEFSDAELERMHRARGEDYRVPAALHFSHVFVRVEDGDEEGAWEKAVALRGELNHSGIDSSAALGRGDRFLYNRNYVDRTREEVASHFGEEMAMQMSTLEPDSRRWQGPFRSVHGLHLVLLKNSDASRLPEPEEIREVLRQDWLRAQRDAALDRAVAAIVSDYEVEVDPRIESLE